MTDETCPECSHQIHRHSEQQYWPEGTCNDCRREMHPYNTATPRAAGDVCKYTSSEARALLQKEESR